MSVVVLDENIAILNENGIGVAGAPPPSLVLGNFCMPTARRLTLIKSDCYRCSAEYSWGYRGNVFLSRAGSLSDIEIIDG